MLLRSSSTPVLGSLLSSFSETPNNSHFESNSILKNSPSPFHHAHAKLSFHQHSSFNLNTNMSCNSSPISPSVSEFSDHARLSFRGFRRAQSEGNLETLAYVAEDNDEDQFLDRPLPMKFSGKHKHSLMLQSIPSFSFYGSKGRHEEEDESDVEDDQEEEELEGYEEISSQMKGLTSTEEVGAGNDTWNMKFERGKELNGQEMYLARGLGIDGGDGSGRGGGRGEFSPAGSGGEGGEDHGVQEYYKRMVEENPGNPLVLRNYAQFLYQSKGDLQKAEEYYSRAILADPKDGEILTQYAKLVWELHQDQERASNYFKRAAQASPQDSHVHAAYAGFLWETEEDEDECSVVQELATAPTTTIAHLNQNHMASANA